MPHPFSHPSTTHPHLALHTLSLLLTFPAPLLLFLSIYALLLAGITSPFTLLWPYILSSISTFYVLSLERRALSTRTLTRRWYGRLQAYRMAAMVAAYLPFVVASLSSRGMRTMIEEVAGYRNFFWQTMEWLNVVHWLLALLSIAYTPFYRFPPEAGLPTTNSDISLPTDAYTDAQPDETEEESDRFVPATTRPRSADD